MYLKFIELLNKKKLKVADVARETGISPSTFSDWKKGKSKPKVDKLMKIAETLGVPISYFLESEGDKENTFKEQK